MSNAKKRHIMLNKTHCLIYGKFLKHHLGNVEILHYKTPSNTYKVNFEKLIKKLWDEKVSLDNDNVDKTVKKLIANVNFGKLEKFKSILLSKASVMLFITRRCMVEGFM